jgi:putative tryptophan/tyrosine transport system substrate-binding protein
MRRREFITVLGGAAAAWPLAARAQQSERMRRIGVLMNMAADDPEAPGRVAALAQGLGELGWTVGRNVMIDYRWGAGDTERIRKHAAELVALAPQVILVTSSEAVAILLQATRTVPTVFVNLPDPVGAGFVIAWLGRAATSPGSSGLNTAWPRNGWSCSKRLRLKRRAWR